MKHYILPWRDDEVDTGAPVSTLSLFAKGWKFVISVILHKKKPI